MTDATLTGSIDPPTATVGSGPIEMRCTMANTAVYEFLINGEPAGKLPGVLVGLDYIRIPTPSSVHVGSVLCTLPGKRRERGREDGHSI